MMPFRAFQRLCAAALLLVLAACGPGIGGTGTGAELVGPGTTGAAAQPAPLCASDLAVLLRCAPAASGSQLTWLADGAATRDALLRVEGNSVDFDAACSGWQFSGDWGTVGSQPARFHGTVRNVTSGAAAQAGTLTARRVDATVVLELFDATGRSLAGPFTLLVVPAAPPVGTCR